MYYTRRIKSLPTALVAADLPIAAKAGLGSQAGEMLWHRSKKGTVMTGDFIQTHDLRRGTRGGGS